MSLMRLLTTGKSWVGGDEASRYRLRRNLLPKFGSGQNPFSSPRTKTASAPVPESEAGHEPEREAEPVLQSGPGESPSAREIPKPVTSARGAGVAIVRKPLKRESRVRLLWGQASLWLGGCIGKINPVSWWSQRRRKVKPAIPRFNKTPVQGELSLEQVKVVRNDLSDADLEVVPARSGAVRHKAQPVERVEAVLSGPPGDESVASQASDAREQVLSAGKT